MIATSYTVRLSARARAAALVTVAHELERLRDKRPADATGGRCRADAMAEMEEVLDALTEAVPSDQDAMPEATIRRIVARTRAANEEMAGVEKP